MTSDMADAIEIMARAIAAAKGIEICNDATYRHSSFGLLAKVALIAITDSGYAVVPIEPTEAMLAVGQDGWLDDPARRSSTLYRAMIESGKVTA